MALIKGTSGDDHLNASDSGDLVRGLAGDDSLVGGAGDDRLYGGSGDDSLWGAGGIDQLFGGSGDDLIQESDGSDELHGGAGFDTLDLFYGTFVGGGIGAFDWSFKAHAALFTPGGASADGFERVDITGSDFNDTIAGGRFGDDLRGWEGDDRLFGGRGEDFLIGDNGDDTMSGAAGDDLISGGGGADQLSGGDGDDTLIGGSSFDVFGGSNTLVGGAGADELHGGRDVTTISYASSGAGVEIHFAQQIAHGGDAEGDTFVDAAGLLIGTRFADILEGDIGMQGGRGADQLIAGWGTTVMTGGHGRDLFVIQFDHEVIWDNTTITDFDQARRETIDLSRVDARAAPGDQAFTFIGTDAFDARAGEVRYEVVGDQTKVEFSTGHHGFAEHTVWLDGVYALTEGDFVL